MPSNGNGGKKGKYDPNVYLPVLEGQEITDPWQVPIWGEMPRIISTKSRQEGFTNLGETKKITAVNPEANDNTSDEAED